MKKSLGIVVALLVVLVFCTAAVAGTIGNPNATVQNQKYDFSFDTDLTNRDMDIEGASVHEMDSSRFLVKGTYGLETGNIPLNLYAKLGMANAESDEAGSEFDGDYGMAYQLGMKATVYEKSNMQWGVGLQYLSYTTEESVLGVTAEMDCSEMDLFAGTSYLGLNKVVPYGGLHFSMVDGEVNVLGTKVGEFEEADSVGLFMGADMGLTDQFRGGAEVRLVSETSFSLNFSYLF
ncbi:MAG: hypothetical protein ACMUIL_07255 [bacterium]